MFMITIDLIISYISVQHECIPQAILSMDILCQAKSGMGKTAVFVLATLQQLEPVDGQVSLCLYSKMYGKMYGKIAINRDLRRGYSSSLVFLYKYV